jgi:hypothetical protein
MGFTLKVTFTGMLLYVPDAENALYVLFPPTGGTAAPGVGGHDHGGHAHGAPARGTGGGASPHVARLVYDTAYTGRGRARLDGVDAQVSLRGRELTLESGTGGGIDGAPPRGLLRLGTARPELLGPRQGHALTARVVVKSGSFVPRHHGACWKVDGEVRQMAHIVEWVIPDMPGESLTLALRELSFEGAETEVGPLYPVGEEIHLQVWHAPADEAPPQDDVPPAPEIDDPAPHFAALNALLVTPSPWEPRFAGMECAEREEGGCRGSGVSCMGGGG